MRQSENISECCQVAFNYLPKMDSSKDYIDQHFTFDLLITYLFLIRGSHSA